MFEYPIDDTLPDFESIKNPQVREYMKKKYAAAQNLQGAQQDQQQIGALTDAAGSGIETLLKANQSPTRYVNRWADKGKPQRVEQPDAISIDTSPIQKALGNRVNQAQAGVQGVQKDFAEQRDLTKYERDEADLSEKSDPNSQVSKTYQGLAARYMPGQDWTGVSAAQLEKSLPVLGKAYEAEIASKDRQTATDRWEAEMALKRDELNRKGQAPGKQAPTVPSEVAGNVGKFDSATQLVDDLDTAWEANTGTFSGVTQFLPNTDAGKYNDQAKIAAQTIGSILEGGKLTDNDYDKYLKMLPTPGDSKATKANKIAILKRQIELKKQGSIAGLTSAGYNTSGFNSNPAPKGGGLGAGLPQGMQDAVNKRSGYKVITNPEDL